MEEVANERLIMFDLTSSYYEITQAAFLSAGVKLRGLMELDSIEAAKKMVERSLGVALLPRTAVAREVESKTLRLVTMKDAPPMYQSIVAYRRAAAGPRRVRSGRVRLPHPHPHPLPRQAGRGGLYSPAIGVFYRKHHKKQLDEYHRSR